MKPSLYAVLGPLKGSTFELNDDELTIGRDRSNRVPIADLHLSRRHCCIRKEADGYTLIDLNSTNGVLLNGIPVRQHKLQHGDRIEFGSSMLLFVEREDAGAIEASLSDETLQAGSLVTVRWDSTPAKTRGSQELELLLRISTAISTLRNLTELGQKLLDLVFEVVPSTRGAIMLYDPAHELHLLCRKNPPGSAKSFILSKQVLQQVVTQKAGLLANDLNPGGNHGSSLLCAPIVLFGDVLGVMYLDNYGVSLQLTEAHLQLLNAITNIAAPAIKNVQDLKELKDKAEQLAGQLSMERKLVGESPQIKKLLDLIARIAPSSTTVLIRGESGTGKELAARAIHENSPRAEKAFVAINCAALPDNLIESEIFGHEKGAFTGAIAQKPGKLELANGGTLFLDEIGELAPGLQSKLLRVLQEREFERLGGTRTIKTDIRLLAATNRDLEKMVESGDFRQDLYYRINVVTLKMPALREMKDDILLLARYLIAQFNQKLTRQVRGISPEAQQFLLNYDWPGNVRELENTIERAILLGSTDMILPEDLPESFASVESPTTATPKNLQESVNEHKRELILKAFEGSGSNFNTAAEKLGIHAAHLYRLVRTLKIESLIKK